jgi:hypothetical protein
LLFLMMLPSFWSWGQNCSGFIFDVKASEDVDCRTVKVPVNLSSTSGHVCNMSITGSIEAANAVIESVVIASGVTIINDYTVTIDGSSFTVSGQSTAVAVAEESDVPFFEVQIKADPGEAFSFSLDDISFDLGSSCGTSCTAGFLIFNSQTMQGPSVNQCGTTPNYKFVVDADDTGGDMVIIPLDHFDQRGQYASVPVKFVAPDRDAMEDVRVLDFEIEVDDVYGNLHFTDVDFLIQCIVI